ncbi:MAG TPA: hypothetical protein VKA46_06500 [Gemmataceae bacterium]|nr:hypothetical protein [Gemmataceae bacterium]
MLPRLLLRRRTLGALVLGALVLCCPPGRAADGLARLFDALPARCLGPANMGGRVSDLAVVESRPATLYVATASGGLWKTTNNGTTWDAVFERETTVSLGAVAVAPSNPDVVWVGTGEANPRNSVAWGDGVYKSSDGGKTWRNVGLRDTQHVGRVVIHPTNPDVVYVAALGHVWGPNKERGLYKTTDGGATWKQVKYLDADTGFIDLVMDPDDPNTLYAAAYRVRRDAFSGGNPAEQTGPLAGLYKTTDGGNTWKRLGKGLPDRPLGRCGLAVYRKDPRVLYAVVQTDATVLRRETEWGQPARTNADPSTGGVFRSGDRGETWVKLNDLCPRPFYFSQVRIDPGDDRRLYVLGVTLHASRDGGRTFATDDAAPGVHADLHALWIDPKDPEHMVAGSDGGAYLSYDRGKTWEHPKNLPIGQFYAVAVDMSRPYWVYGGLQDNGSWGGPSATRNADGVTGANWFRVLAMDGFYCQVDPGDANLIYAEGQYGELRRVNLATGLSIAVKPRPGRGEPEYRFNWNSPILLSPHNPAVVYFGGNGLFRSRDRGDHWDVISPDLTLGQRGRSPDFGHTLTTIAESPIKADVLWVGSDDGRVQVSRNGGRDWGDVSAAVPDVPRERHVSRVIASSFAEGTAYLAIDRHRNDDRRPYLFRTTDHGGTWKPIMSDLPEGGPVYVVRESSRNPDLLLAGTEFGLFVSLDSGGHWEKYPGLPTVAVHDLVIHPRDRELVIGTHGRSIYVVDVAPLEQATAKVLAAPVHLFDVKSARMYPSRGTHGLRGVKMYAAPNPPFGAVLYYHLREKSEAPVRLVISDARGSSLIELKGTQDAGLHRLVWPLRTPPAEGSEVGSLVAPGEYVAELRVGERVLTKRFRVEADE